MEGTVRLFGIRSLSIPQGRSRISAKRLGIICTSPIWVSLAPILVAYRQFPKLLTDWENW